MMQIDDPGLFSVVIPTFNGTPFLRRTLDYFRHVSFKGQVILSDNSSGDHREFVASCSDDYPELRIEAFLFPQEIRFLDKIVATLEKIDAQFVMLHAHDDFMVPAAVDQCVDFLARNSAYSVARGRVGMFALARDANAPGGQAAVSLVPHPMRAYEQQDAVERMLAHIERYASTFYSVHRRQSLIESFRITEAATKNVIFFQYLSSCICALKGKVWCSDNLFYVRQGHADSWSGRLKNSGDYEHWPMLITSPDFSRHYQQFRATLCQLVESSFNQPATAVGPRIDVAALGLFQRGYCGREVDNPEEAQFLKRLHDPNSDDNRLLTSVVDFTFRYPQTF
jgi:glycosyltransferase domain-containing protein